MTIIDNIIKRALKLSNKFSSNIPAMEAQEKMLRYLLKQAANTEFGQYYKFRHILRSNDAGRSLREIVPIHDFDKMQREWWHKVAAGNSDITWPGKPDYLALSSGTTSGSSKRIPVTAAMLRATRKTSLQQIRCLPNFDLPDDFYGKEIMMLCGSTNLIAGDRYREGDISGISAANIPFWFKGFCKPGEAISSIDDWDERIQKIAEKAPEWDIGSLSGIPSWIELMLKKIVDYHGLRNIHEIWPNLKVYATGGVAFGPYKKSFEKLLAGPLIYIDTYFASEGFLAFQQRPDAKGMALALNNGIYFEFIPFREENVAADGEIKPGAEVLTLAETKEDEEYVLVISTVSGAWRYVTGDTIKFTDKAHHEIAITGRTTHFLNVVGSKLSVSTMNKAMQIAEQELGITIKEFTVAAVLKEDEYAHQWYIGCNDPVDPSKIADILDRTFKSMNRSYNTARKQALRHVFVKTIPPDTFYEWNAFKNKKGGQVKTPRVMKEEQFREWEDFVHSPENTTHPLVPADANTS